MSDKSSKKNKITFNDFIGDTNGKIVFFLTVGLMLAVIIMAIIGITCTDTSGSNTATTPTTTSQPKTKEDLLEDFMMNAGDYNAAVSSYMAEQEATTTAAPETAATEAAPATQ